VCIVTTTHDQSYQYIVAGVTFSPFHGTTYRAGNQLAEVTHFICPLSKVLMTDPVVANDGVSYQRDALTKYIAERRGKLLLSPTNGKPIAKYFFPNL
jgi:hypothetical protein